MNIIRIAVGPLEANCWLVDDGLGGPVVVIDPGADAHLVLEALGGRSVGAIMLTHAHFDHVGAVDQVRAATGAPVAIHAADAVNALDEVATGASLFGMAGKVSETPEEVLEDGCVRHFGELRVEVLHTPGHSPGGVCLLVAAQPGGVSHLFSGDTLFAGSVGRTDFPGGDARQLSHAIASKLAVLDPQTVVHPGHGPDTTIGREARINPFWPRA